MFVVWGALKVTISSKMSTEELVKEVMNQNQVSYQEAISILLQLTEK